MRIDHRLVLALFFILIVPKAFAQFSPLEKHYMEERHKKIIEALKIESTPEKIKSNLFNTDEVLSGVYSQEMLDAYEDFFNEYPNLATPNSQNGFFKTFHEARDLKVLIRSVGIKEYYLGKNAQDRELQKLAEAIGMEGFGDTEKLLLAHWLYRNIDRPYKQN
jgi:hypothetical protein